MDEKYKIYIDMDGVVADFDMMAKKVTNGGYKTPGISNNSIWKAIYHYDSNVAPFFESLPKLPGADQLVEFISSNFSNFAFLTATGTTPKNAAEQKRNWVRKHYGNTIKVYTVVKSAEKAVYANPRSVLIDDRDKAIDPWKRAGGIGILHTNNMSTIGDLNMLLD